MIGDKKMNSKHTEVIKSFILSILGVALMIGAGIMEITAADLINLITECIRDSMHAKAIGALLVFVIESACIVSLFVIGLFVFVDNFSDDKLSIKDKE